MIAATTPAAGKVANQPRTILFITLRSTEFSLPLAIPTPAMLPIKTDVVDMGKPIAVQINTASDAPYCAANPLLNVNEVIFFPTVSITL